MHYHFGSENSTMCPGEVRVFAWLGAPAMNVFYIADKYT